MKKGHDPIQVMFVPGPVPSDQGLFDFIFCKQHSSPLPLRMMQSHEPVGPLFLTSQSKGSQEGVGHDSIFIDDNVIRVKDKPLIHHQGIIISVLKAKLHDESGRPETLFIGVLRPNHVGF